MKVWRIFNIFNYLLYWFLIIRTDENSIFIKNFGERESPDILWTNLLEILCYTIQNNLLSALKGSIVKDIIHNEYDALWWYDDNAI